MNGTLKAEVKNGCLLLNEPTNLPDGTILELSPTDPFGMLKNEGSELNASIDRGTAQARNGEGRPLDKFLSEL